MSNKKRIAIIILLILTGILIISITKIYENKIIKRNEIKEINNYTPFEKISNYKTENKERYIRYYENNKNLSYEETVTKVNIGLDYNYYEYIKKSDMDKDILILVNKYLKLDENYIPNDLEEINSKYFINGNKEVRLLRKEAKIAFEKLSEDSIKNGTPVYGQSAYRSYERQEEIYNNLANQVGNNKADLDTARPGHSEHQTGLTIDVSSTKEGNMLRFEASDSYNWMINNAYKYGFILRYPKSKENIHGFVYESWHFRYVGINVATDMHNNYSNLTFEEYYYKKIDK